MIKLPFGSHKFISREIIVGEWIDFFMFLEIKRSNLFKAVGRRIEAVISERAEKREGKNKL